MNRLGVVGLMAISLNFVDCDQRPKPDPCAAKDAKIRSLNNQLMDSRGNACQIGLEGLKAATLSLREEIDLTDKNAAIRQDICMVRSRVSHLLTSTKAACKASQEHAIDMKLLVEPQMKIYQGRFAESEASIKDSERFCYTRPVTTQ